MFYWIIRTIAVILFKLLFRLQAFGQKNVPGQGGFILASNHLSYLDPPVLAAACPRMLSFLAKEGLFKSKYFGRFIKALNAFPLRTHFADVRSLRWAIKELKAGKALIIFPEGGRSATGELDEPQAGVGFLALKAGVRIVPTFIAGANHALPFDSKSIHLKKIKVYFGKAIELEKINVQSDRENPFQAIAQRTMDEIKKLKEKSEQKGDDD